MRRPILVRVLAALVLLLAAAWVFLATDRIARAADSPYPLVANLSYHAGRARMAAFARSDIAPETPLTLAARLERGETLHGVLERVGLNPTQAHDAVEAASEFLDPRRMRAGSRYVVAYDAGGRPQRVTFDASDKGRVQLLHRDDFWYAEWSPFERSVSTRVVRGSIESSLEAALVAAGGPTILASRMADVLQWDLDFHRDLRRGDRFELLFEETFLDGERHGVGQILALRYVGQSALLDAYRFGATGHYDADGRPLRKLFLRSPLKYSTRITSGFSPRRFHPVTKTYRPHYGVDYGAPAGTPVLATSSGVVSLRGWTNGGGNTIKIRHPNGYLTAYLHLSGFADGISTGGRVTQGQVIGYVGATGLASGPHLDYRVQHRNRWINPALLRGEPAAPIPQSRRSEFLARRDSLRRRLDDASSPPAPDTVGTVTAAGGF